MMKKYLVQVLAVVLACSLLAGCGSAAVSSDSSAASVSEETETAAESSAESEAGESEAEETEDAEAPEETEVSEPAEAEEPEEEPEDEGPVLTEEQQALIDLIPEGEALTFQSYPLTEEPETLTMFYSMHPLLTQYYDDASELPIYENVEAITGVHIEFNSVSYMAVDTQLGLMIASGDLNDIMPLAMYYTAGADAAVEQELIYDLTDWIPEYAVNYQGLIDYNENFKEEVTTAEGNLVGFSLYSMDNTRIYISGPEIRKDWLDEVGLDVPVTLDDYHEMLLAFKNQLGVATPMWLHYSGINKDNQLTRAFDINGIEMLLIDGQVTSSLLQPGFHDYLEMMNQWYSEGLVDPDFFSTTDEEPDLAVVANDTYGLFYQYASDYPELYSYASDPDFEILAITDAVQEEGDKLKISNGLDSEASPEGNYNITTACENVPLACMWLDYFYSPDGWLMSNYGIEGVSFEYDEDGIPHWTEAITNTDYPDFVAKCRYTLLQGAYLMHADREFDSYTQEMIDASDLWASVEADGDYLNLPAYVTLDSNVSSEVMPIWSDIDTYVDECLVKFIVGDLNMDSDYDAFVQTLYDMDIETVIAAYQDAYDTISANRS